MDQINKLGEEFAYQSFDPDHRNNGKNRIWKVLEKPVAQRTDDEVQDLIDLIKGTQFFEDI
jgi:hypothetical protein